VQRESLFRSRTRQCAFTTQFARSQAVECFAEWAIAPDNTTFQRISDNVYDPRAVGDKAKWFSHDLECIRRRVWDDASSLNGVLRSLRGQDEPATGSYQYFISALAVLNKNVPVPRRKRRERQRGRGRRSLPALLVLLFLLLPLGTSHRAGQRERAKAKGRRDRRRLQRIRSGVLRGEASQ